MMKYFLTIFFILPVIAANAQTIDDFNMYLANSNQVIFVKTPGASSVEGEMFLYQRKNAAHQWKLVDSFAVVVGKNGLAKAAGTRIPLSNMLPTKHEGDGKSPAGIFQLGKVFSYHDIKNLKMPFVQVDTNFYCVDDTASAYYNTLIRQDTAKQSFNSFEYMYRHDDLYEYGVWVLHNSDPVVAADGSCIFLHIWRNAHSGTSGCTAMQKENILRLIYWLDKKKNPVLLQVLSN
jgi:D-alanyl-D-alanine dipeptidase